MEFVPLLALGALVTKFLDALKLLTARDWNGVVTQVSAWVAGVVAVLLVAQTDFATSINVGEEFTLADVNLASQVFFGLVATSLLSLTYDFKKALDSTDTAVMPSLTKL